METKKIKHNNFVGHLYCACNVQEWINAEIFMYGPKYLSRRGRKYLSKRGRHINLSLMVLCCGLIEPSRPPPPQIPQRRRDICQNEKSSNLSYEQQSTVQEICARIMLSALSNALKLFPLRCNLFKPKLLGVIYHAFWHLCIYYETNRYFSNTQRYDRKPDTWKIQICC